MFDSTMNYVQTKATLSYFGAKYLHGYQRSHLELEPIGTQDFIAAIEDNLGAYDEQINQAMLNLLGSHDMARPLWIMGDNLSAMKLAFNFMMTMPGAPCIYYGDEIGMSGADDPYCRAAYPWGQTAQHDLDLCEHVKSLVALRHQFKVLRTGTFRFLDNNTDSVVSYLREDEECTLQVILNRDEQPQPIDLPAGEICFGSLDRDGCLSGQAGIVVKLAR